jgi:hypothetical protein
MPNRNYIRPVIIPPGPSIAYIELTQGQFTRIDSDMAKELGQWSWYAHWEPDCRSFYAWRKGLKDGKRITVSMQQQILGLSGAAITGDHLDHNTLNNMKTNLRAATWSQQNSNKKLDRRYVRDLYT